MIGVVIAAHNEAASIEACLDAVRTAVASPLLEEHATIVVVLDACSDATGPLAQARGVVTLELHARNVGIARAAGADYCLAAGARWLAFTDADTIVAPDWLVAQVRLQSDVVCGTVGVQDWGSYGAHLQRHFEQTYTDADGHGHIHGANLGVCARAYQRAGGFAPLQSSEDVALVHALQASGARIAWSAAPRVTTSARQDFRAPGGFGATLARVDREAGQQSADRAC